MDNDKAHEYERQAKGQSIHHALPTRRPLTKMKVEDSNGSRTEGKRTTEDDARWELHHRCESFIFGMPACNGVILRQSGVSDRGKCKMGC